MDGRGSYHHPQYDQTHYAELPVQQQHNYSYPQQYPAHRPGYSSPGVVYELPPQDNHIKSHAQELPKSGAYIHELPIGQHDISYNQPSGYHGSLTYTNDVVVSANIRRNEAETTSFSTLLYTAYIKASLTDHSIADFACFDRWSRVWHSKIPAFFERRR